jgi:hypothetical protein
VHKSQGVTVDRTHVLASSHMDRHAAYVGLSRHRERVDLHWSRDQVGSRERLTRVLGREQLQDTSLDYRLTSGGTAKQPGIQTELRDSVRGYAERPGLVPASEIVLRERSVASEPVVSARPRRSLFAGLKLDAARSDPVATQTVSPAPLDRDGATDQLARSVGAYARAWADADRMRQAGFPGLPHQTTALAQAGQVVDAQRPRLGQDLDAALTRTPELAQRAGTNAGLTALIEAGLAYAYQT